MSFDRWNRSSSRVQLQMEHWLVELISILFATLYTAGAVKENVLVLAIG
jgi:hypothetical protein